MADAHNDPALADIIERLENVEAVLAELVSGDDGPGPDDDPGVASETGDRRRTGDAATNLRARLLAADAATRARTTALLKRMNERAAEMWRRR